QVLKTEESQSGIFKNDGKGNFRFEPFPLMAQLSTVNAIYIDDINGDKNKDVIMAGNFYGLKPQGGRFDASYGTTLLSDGRSGFTYIPPSESGFFVNGEVRDIKPLGKSLLLVG
ncbi:MAG: hypothetical protein J7497_16710, partial [Chitinophagaceae bacterium]|nr:hypothetical protein [Chitinophagaceae bacterium]